MKQPRVVIFKPQVVTSLQTEAIKIYPLSGEKYIIKTEKYLSGTPELTDYSLDILTEIQLLICSGKMNLGMDHEECTDYCFIDDIAITLCC